MCIRDRCGSAFDYSDHGERRFCDDGADFAQACAGLRFYDAFVHMHHPLPDRKNKASFQGEVGETGRIKWFGGGNGIGTEDLKGLLLGCLLYTSRCV